ncbi:MAG: heme-binding protein [Actinomycetes bacterium]|jgi:uncharacterized protein GlcG (DUF336 family)
MNLELALRMCEVAVREARRLGALVSVAVVDGGGHLVAFQRMDGAGIGGSELAPAKAYTAVALGRETAELAPLTAPGEELYGLPLRFACLPGGVPLRDADAVIGGVGVSGGSPEQDVACARIAASLWEDLRL